MKLKSNFAAVLTVAVMLFAACSTPPPPVETPVAIDMDALRVEIQAMEDAYSAAEAAKDAEGVMKYYSDDVVSYNRDMEPLSGKDAVKNRIAERLAADSSGSTNVYKVIDLYADGDMAVEIGSWQDIKSDGTEGNHGFYMSYFQKRDGKYVCVRDMNVSAMPAKKAGM